MAFIQELGDTTLDSFLRNTNPTEGQRKTIAKQLLRTLRRIHRKGIAHNDLKCANILVFLHPLQAKITDFGLSEPITPDLQMHDIANIMGIFSEIFPDKDRELMALCQQMRNRIITMDDALHQLEQYT